MRAVRRPPIQIAQLAQLLGLIGVAGGELSRIAQALGDENLISEAKIAATVAEFREAARSIMRLLGKRIHDH